MTSTPAILWETFGFVGLASTAGWAGALLLLAAGTARSHRWTRWLLAVCLAAAGVLLAEATSASIRTIEVDRSAEVLAAEAAGAKVAQEKFRSRAANIRFAEDTEADQVDVAGVSVAEEKGAYERAVEEELEKVPAYRSRGKQARAGQRARAEGKETDEPDAESTEAATEPSPVAEEPVRSLPESQLVIADRFDRGNRAAAWSLVALAAGLCGIEYVRRFNTTADAVWPVPLAGSPVDGLASKEHVASLPSGRLAAFLELAVRKGETFIAFVETDPLPDRHSLDRIGLGPFRWELPKRTLSAAALATDPGLLEIVFETAWFGRGCFLITGERGVATVFESFLEACRRRSRTRASTRRTLDLVWALPCDPPPAADDDLVLLAPRLNVRWLRPA